MMTPSPVQNMVSAKRPLSEKAFELAQSLMPGGVNSPVRAFRSVGGNPIFFKKAKGVTVWDIDDNPYLDYVGSWGPMILGHAHPRVIHRLRETAEWGTSFGAPTLLENELAAKVIQLVPSIEKVRFVSSGTEAVMSAVRLARAYTGKTKIIKFAGCYHGHADYLLVKAGSGATTLGIPDSAGISDATANDTLIAQFNDIASVDALFERYPEQIAAVLIEPVAGNMGCIPPVQDFLRALRLLTQKRGALLIFDEVMTGFRVALGGAQALYQIQPDLTTLGKIVGGGLPAAAYGGKKEIMATVAPEGPMYQAGTLSGNPLAMAAGLETLSILESDCDYQQLAAKTDYLLKGLLEQAQQAGIPASGHAVCGMLTLFFNQKPIKDYATALTSDTALFARFFWAMIEQGIYWPPSQFEALFLSFAHQETHLEQTIQAAGRALQAIASQS